MATVSTPARSRRSSQAADAPTSHHPSCAASPRLDQTVRFPLSDALRLYLSNAARDSGSLVAIAREITTARAPLSSFTSQSSSFAILRQSQGGSPVENGNPQARRSHRPSPSPERTHSSRSSARADSAVSGPLARTVAQLVEQVAAQSAVLYLMMQRLETLQPARRSHVPACRTQQSPSRPNGQVASPIYQHPPHRQSAPNPDAPTRVSLSPAARSLALDPRAMVHVPLGAAKQAHLSATASRDASPLQLGAAQQSHQLAPPPLARSTLASPVSLAPVVSRAMLVSLASLVFPALFAQTPNCAKSPQWGHLLMPLALPPLSRAAPFELTVRSTVFAERAARREYCGGAAYPAAWHHINEVRSRAARCITACHASSARTVSARGC